MTEEEIAALLEEEAKKMTPEQRQEIIRKGMNTTPVATQPPLETDAVKLLESLTPENVARPDDPMYHSAILPTRVNERTGDITFDPLNEGITGSFVKGITLPGRVAGGEFNDMYTQDQNNDGLYSEEESFKRDQAWGNFIGEAVNFAGNLTLGSGVMRIAGPEDTLTMGLKLPKAAKTQMTAVKAKSPPNAFDVASVDVHAPKNLKSLETPTDLYKTYLIDEKQVLGDLAERAGIPNLEKTKLLIDQDTQATALMRVNEAIRGGKLSTATGNYDIKVPVSEIYKKYKELPQPQQVDADQYMKLRDYRNDLNLMIAKKINPTKAQEELAVVEKSIFDLEQRTPLITELAQEYRNATEAVRQFLSTGPNAIFDQKALQGLQLERPDYVPIDITGVNPAEPLLARISDANKALELKGMQDWFTQARDLKNINGIDNRVDSFEILLDYTRNALQHKMENDVRGNFLSELMNSQYGKETVRKLAKDEVGKYSDRVVSVYENGKKVDYLSSKLQRDLLQFDPYIARMPLLYNMKRLWEMGSTGPLSITFAPTTLLRDMITGSVLNEAGVAKPGIFGTLKAVPEQVFPKFYRAAAETLKSSSSKIPFLDDVTKNKLADNMARRYTQSHYALSNQVGGIDASLMKSNIQAHRGAWREITRSLDDSAFAQNPAVKTLGHSLKTLAHGWDSLFGAISDAPRFAVFKKQVEAGVDPSLAAVQARRITGDTSRGGRAFMPDGTRIMADVQNKSALAPSKAVAYAATGLRELFPYYNPSIQGMRRLATRLVADPMRTQLNAWKYVGIPGLAAYAWNEMLGPEYNDYAQKHRNETDMALNMYIAVPGQPPEKGIEFPIGHEMMPWLSPWNTALYNLGRGDEDVMKGLMHSGANILKNGSMIGYPVGGTQLLALSGIKAPQTILSPMDSVYEMREDNVGLLPQNIEALSRSVFGSISDVALMSAAAAYDGGPRAFFDELGWQIGKRTPILKNAIGAKTAVTNFTPKSNELHRKVDEFNNFIDLYEQHYGESKDKVQSSITGADFENDPTLQKLSPNLTPTPTNPVFKYFGDVVKSTMGTNAEGFTGLRSRSNVLNKQIKLLRGYTAGRKEDFKEYQKQFVNAEAEYKQKLDELEKMKGAMDKKSYNKALSVMKSTYGEKAKAAALLKELDIDLSKRSDVNKLINRLEMDRYSLVTEQVATIKNLEERMTGLLQKQGMLPAGTKFEIEKHLSSSLPKDFQVPQQTQPSGSLP